MLSKSTLLHLRIPFSFFLLPIYLFALFASPDKPFLPLIISIIAIHLFLYPASNGYNSYFDKDEYSIGGLKKPPKVSSQLYWVSLVFDLVAIILGLLISIPFAVMLFIYGLISKAYSHPSVRLKKMPYIGWLAAGLFQGYFTFMMVIVALNGFEWHLLWQWQYVLPALLSSLFLWGSYPMTQVYQHAEDKRRGDITLSIKLGVLGTFHFTAIMFIIANAGFAYYFITFYSIQTAVFYVIVLLPVLIFFFIWYIQVRKDTGNADFGRTMWLNLISAATLNLFFATAIFIY
ncbi:MAG: UbiA family prenyltransferase [Cyclobacteriaceae bacterium]